MKKYFYKELSEKQKSTLMNRTRNIMSDIDSDVKFILENVKKGGLKSEI